MARIEADMLGHRPFVTMRDADHAVLTLPTTAGTISLSLLPFQGRELATILSAAFGTGESREAFCARLVAESREQSDA